MELTDEQLAEQLTTLGTTADEVAQSLRNSDIKGYVGGSDSCPVANWLKAKYPDEDFIRVWGDVVHVDGATVTLDIDNDPVADFIERFDHYYYSDLQE